MEPLVNYKEDEGRKDEEEEEIIYESKLVNCHQEEIRLSRIFEEIVIKDEIHNADNSSSLF